MSASPRLRQSSWALRFTPWISKGETEFIKCTSSEIRLPGDKQHAASALAYTCLGRAIKARWRLNYINFITGRPDPEWLTRQGGWSDELQWNYCQSAEKWIKRLTPWCRDLQWESSDLPVRLFLIFLHVKMITKNILSWGMIHSSVHTQKTYHHPTFFKNTQGKQIYIYVCYLSNEFWCKSVSPFCFSSCGRWWHNWSHYCIRHTRVLPHGYFRCKIPERALLHVH